MLLLAPAPPPATAGRRTAVRCSSVHELERSPQPRPGASLPPLRAAKRVVLVRHGQSTWNAEGRIQGSSDVSVLTPKGESQAETSRQMLLSDSFDACFTSPLARSRRTAEIIWEGRGDDLIPDSDLREIDLYSFQGLLKHEGKERYGVVYRQWQKNAANFSIDGHCPVRELWDRAQSCWERILAHEGKSVLVVAHNAVNQALVATSLGLGVEYFRVLLQSNCGVSVLDFTPKTGGGPPNVCLNRSNQTPNSPVAAGSSGGRKASKRIILACQGTTLSSSEISLGGMGYAPLNMLGTIQSQKTAELLLDLKVNSIICSPQVASVDTSTAICEVQEAADCLGADCVPRYVEMKNLLELEIDDAFQAKQKSFGQSGWMDSMEYKTLERLWTQSKDAWQVLLNELPDDSESDRVVVAVGHPAIHLALICRCLDLPMEYMSSFHLDDGSISVIDFPDGPKGRGVVRCTNYTAHLGRWSIPITRPTENDEVLTFLKEPVTVRQPLYFDYTEAQPSAAVALGGARGVALPAGHSVRVSMALLLPDSYHNREVGMFQIKAEAISVSGITMASAAQPYMRYKSTPVRLAQSALMCVPLTLGVRSETQTANLKVLQYREGHGRHKRTGLIRVLLQPRAAIVQLPQVYKAEIVVQTTPPWTKSLARGLIWTLFVWVSFSVYIVLVVLAICWVRPLAASARNRRLSELPANGMMASHLGTVDIGESPSHELSGDFKVKRRERRSKRKSEFRAQLHGGSTDLEFTEGSTSSVAVVDTAQAVTHE